MLFLKGFSRSLLQQARFVGDRRAHEVGHPLGDAARDVQVDRLRVGLPLEKLLVPVDVGVDVGVQLVDRSLDRLLREFRLGPGRARFDGLVEHPHVLYAVGEFGNLCGHRHAPLDAQVDFRFAALPGFRRHDHHAVCAARSVERRRRGILEDREILDHLGGEGVQVVRGALHAVDQDQRILRGLGKGAYAANPEIRSVGARLSGLLHRDHAGDAACETVREVGGGHLHVGGLERLDRADDALLLLLAEPDHHHLFHHPVVLVEDDVADALGPGRDLLVQIADVAVNERRMERDVDHVRTVDVGRHSDRRPLHDHVHTRQRVSLGVGDRAGDPLGPGLLPDGFVLFRGAFFRLYDEDLAVLDFVGVVRRSENLVEDRFDAPVFHVDRDAAVDVDDVVGIKENVFGFFLDLCEHLLYGFVFGVDR